MRLTINGDEQDIPLQEQSIAGLVAFLGFTPGHVVVECNSVVYKGDDAQYCLQNGDVLEVVRFIGGGSSLFLA
jgi:thiamine biosynthesis protein ThiS